MSPMGDECPACPWCGGETDAEFVDIGVGFQQVTPFVCVDCQAAQWYPDSGLDASFMPPEGLRDGFLRGDPEVDRLGTPVEKCAQCEVFFTRAESYLAELKQEKMFNGGAKAEKENAMALWRKVTQEYRELKQTIQKESEELKELRKKVVTQELELAAFRGRLGQQTETDEPVKRFTLLEIDE